MKIVQIINGLGRGGGERLLVDLVRAARGRCRFSVYTLTRGGPLARELEELGVAVRPLRWRGLPLPWRFAALLTESGRADVLHTHFFWSDLLGAVVSAATGVRLVSTRHETGYWMRAHHRFIERRMLRRFARVLCVSAAVRDSLTARGAPPDLLSVAPPGVPLPEQPALSRPVPLRIVSIGRLERVKGHDLLLEAFAELRREPRFAAAELLLIGDGRQRRVLEAQARARGLAGAARFLGEQPHPQALAELRSACCFVLPSRDEGLPVSLLEAMAAGVPCLAARAGGVAELIEHGRTGWLVEPGSASALAAGLAQLLGGDAGRIGAAARREVEERWSDRAFVARVLEAYGAAAPRGETADVCMLLRNDFTVDARVERQASALAAAGNRVLVLAEGAPGLARQERREGYAVLRLPIAAPRSLVAARERLAGVPLLGRASARLVTLTATARFNLGALRRIAAEVPAAVQSHDLDTLLAGAVGAALVGARLVYDSHELWRERNHGLRGLAERLDRWKYGLLERLLIGRADAVLTVSDGIASELAGRYGIERPIVLRNVPPAEPCGAGGLRRAAGAGGPILLHLGVVDRERGLEEVVQALPDLPGARLVLLGPARPGPLAALRALAGELGVAERVLYLPPVPRREILSWAAEADVGLCTFLPSCKSHVLALPNKLFEYSFAGLPLVASDLPDIRRWVLGHRLGALCDPRQPKELARAVRDVLEGRVPLASAEERARLRREHGWERERHKLGLAFPGLVPGPI